MMFVSGETADVAPETTSMIEFIVQQQVMEMVCGFEKKARCNTQTKIKLSLPALLFSLLDVACAPSAQMILSSSFDMTEPK